jgi:hypothetical protein
LDFWLTNNRPTVSGPEGSALLNVLFDESESTMTPPELSCVTSAELVFPAVAEPELASADEVPVLVPELPFVASPPVLPVMLPDESPDSSPPM